MNVWIILVMLFTAATGAAQTLSIDSAEVDVVRDQLLIYGDFGGSQGRVEIDSMDLNVIRWMPNWIRVDLPRSGRGSAGDIVVSNEVVRGTPSRLTSWDVKIDNSHIISDGRNNWDVYGEGGSHYFASFRGVMRNGRTMKLAAARSASAYASDQFREYTSLGQNAEYKVDGRGYSAGFQWADSTDNKGVFAILSLGPDGLGEVRFDLRGQAAYTHYTEMMKNGVFSISRDTTYSGVGGATRIFQSDSAWSVEPFNEKVSPCQNQIYRSECSSSYSITVRFPPADRVAASVSSFEPDGRVEHSTEIYDLLGRLMWKSEGWESMPRLERGRYLIRTIEHGVIKTTRILQR